MAPAASSKLPNLALWCKDGEMPLVARQAVLVTHSVVCIGSMKAGALHASERDYYAREVVRERSSLRACQGGEPASERQCVLCVCASESHLPCYVHVSPLGTTASYATRRPPPPEYAQIQPGTRQSTPERYWPQLNGQALSCSYKLICTSSKRPSR